MEPEEERILVLAARHDPQQFGLLFDAYYREIFGYVLHRTGDYDVARDVASETFLHAFLALPRFQWKGISISHWLYRIATNEIRQFHRAKRYAPESLDRLISTGFDLKTDATVQEARNEWLERIGENDEFVFLANQIKQLSLRYQEVLTLRYFERKSIKDIASILGKKEGTVKSLLSRAVVQLTHLTGNATE